jgi:hypothetical protein
VTVFLFFDLGVDFTGVFLVIVFLFFGTDLLANTFFFAEEALDEGFFFPEDLAGVAFFLVAVGLSAGLVLAFGASGFCFVGVFAFRGGLAGVLRTDFFEAINNPFYLNEARLF